MKLKKIKQWIESLPEDFFKKYRHIGYSYPAVPKGWKDIVEKALIEIEKKMWPGWMPMFVKRWIHYLATGNTVYYVKYGWAENLRKKLTKGQMVTDVKEKYASLCIYGYFTTELEKIVDKAEDECDKTCQNCGSKENVKLIDTGWYYRFCKDCEKNPKIR